MSSLSRRSVVCAFALSRLVGLSASPTQNAAKAVAENLKKADPKRK